MREPAAIAHQRDARGRRVAHRLAARPKGLDRAPRTRAKRTYLPSLLNFRIARSLPRGPREEPRDAGARSDHAPARRARATW